MLPQLMLHWENLEPFLTVAIATAVAASGSKPACASFTRTNRWAPCTTWTSPSHLPEHEPVQALGRLIPPTPTKLSNAANCNLAWQQKGWVEHWRCTGERARGKELISAWTISKQTLERHWRLVGEKGISNSLK
jgi:hypothetical protein